MQQLAAFEEKKEQLAALGATVYAASSDEKEQAQTVINRGITFHIAYGITRSDCDLFGGWWYESRECAHASEFILEQNGTVLNSMYASGPIGRMEAAAVVRFLTNREKRERETAAG